MTATMSTMKNEEAVCSERQNKESLRITARDGGGGGGGGSACN